MIPNWLLVFGLLLIAAAFVAAGWVTIRPHREDKDAEPVEQPPSVDALLVRHHAHGPRTGAKLTEGHVHRPSPRPRLYGRRRTPLPQVLHERVTELPTVAADETTAFLVRAVDGQLVYLHKRDMPTVAGEAHRG